MHDIRYAIRSLLKSPAFAIASILTLAIAIGANTAMFSFLYAVVLEPLPFVQPDRIVRVWATDPHNDSMREGASAPDLVDWKQQQTSFSFLTGTTNRMLNLTAPGTEAERIAATGVSHDYFGMLGVVPRAGRSFVPNDDREGAEPVAIISDAFWQRRFAGGNVVGKTITLDGRGFEIVGVMPAAASLSRIETTEVWIPLTLALVPFADERGVHNAYVIGRLRDGVTTARAQREMELISRRLEQQYPNDNKGRGAMVEPLLETMVRDARPRLWILSASVLAVLLIACINVAGLMLARSDSRSRELAVRASLGASRSRLARQLLTESMVLATIGAVAGVVLAFWMTRTLVALAPPLPRGGNVSINAPVLLFALGITVLSAILFGLIPSIRTSSVRPAAALAGFRGVVRGTHTAGRGILVIVEIALAVVLVIGAGLLLRSFSRLMAVDLGVETSNLVTFAMKLPETRYPVPSREEFPRWPAATNFYDELLERVSTLPGVRHSAIAMVHPLQRGWTSRVSVAGQPEGDGPPDEARVRAITPGYFAALGIDMMRGRAISRDDRSDTPPVVVINEALARRYFPGQNPLEKQLIMWGQPRTIVGVVKGERFGGPQAEIEPALYPPLTQMPMSEITLIVRSSGDSAATITSVRDVMRTIDPEIALYDIEPLVDTVERNVATPRFQTVLISWFGVIALLLAAIGLYALIAYQVQQRTNEIGVRLALGATQAEVARLVLRRAAMLAVIGIGVGLAGAYAAGRFLESVLFQISATDPATFAAVPLLLGAIVLIAAWLPTRRAMRVNPAVALRYE